MTGRLSIVSSRAEAAGRRGWAKRISEAWQTSIAGIFDAGRLLVEAKAALAHGEFEAMVESELPFSTQTARKLMKIASDERLANRAHVRVLPASWGTLYELTKLSDEEFERRIEAGEIHPDMERKDASPNRTSFTGNNQWFTPEEDIERARSVLGEIDLDPASHAVAQERVQAKAFFTEEDDGLTKDWNGRVWLNPPYAQPAIGYFIDKIVEEVEAGRVDEAIVLTHNYTDTAWFQKAAAAASCICFTRGRIRFVSPGGDLAAPTQGQAFFYFGANAKRFHDAFSEIGFVVEVLG